MVSGSTVFYLIVSLLICLCLPAVLAAIMIIKYKASWKAFVLGAATFTVFQLLTRIPILNLLQNDPTFILFSMTNTVLYILLLAFSAGVFEEAGRFVGMRFFMKKGLTWKNGVVFGLGHSGVEAFVLVGLPYLGILIALLSGDTAYAGTPPYTFLVGGLERVLTFAIHIGMTLLVLYSVKFKKVRFLLWAILFHTAVDSGLLLQLSGPNVWISEGYVAAFAALAIVIIVRFRPIIDNKETVMGKWRF